MRIIIGPDRKARIERAMMYARPLRTLLPIGGPRAREIVGFVLLAMWIVALMVLAVVAAIRG